MGDHDVANMLRIHADRGEPVRNRTQQSATAFGSGRRIETGIDDEGVLTRADHPDEIIERHALRMLITTEEVVVAEPIQMAVADGVNTIGHVGMSG
jgi:hypothetical protein